VGQGAGQGHGADDTLNTSGSGTAGASNLSASLVTHTPLTVVDSPATSLFVSPVTIARGSGGGGGSGGGRSVAAPDAEAAGAGGSDGPGAGWGTPVLGPPLRFEGPANTSSSLSLTPSWLGSAGRQVGAGEAQVEDQGQLLCSPLARTTRLFASAPQTDAAAAEGGGGDSSQVTVTPSVTGSGEYDTFNSESREERGWAGREVHGDAGHHEGGTEPMLTQLAGPGPSGNRSGEPLPGASSQPEGAPPSAPPPGADSGLDSYSDEAAFAAADDYADELMLGDVGAGGTPVPPPVSARQEQGHPGLGGAPDAPSPGAPVSPVLRGAGGRSAAADSGGAGGAGADSYSTGTFSGTASFAEDFFPEEPPVHTAGPAAPAPAIDNSNIGAVSAAAGPGDGGADSYSTGGFSGMGSVGEPAQDSLGEPRGSHGGGPPVNDATQESYASSFDAADSVIDAY